MTYANASFSFESICTQSGMVACDKHDIGSTPTKIKNKQNKTKQNKDNITKLKKLIKRPNY
jgi:hypothetical protein